MTNLAAFITILAIIAQANGYGTGAPKGACATMEPLVSGYTHPVGSRQFSTPPFSVVIRGGSKTYALSGVQVVINGTFRGFLLQAKTVAGDKVIGQFSNLPFSAKTLDCSKEADSLTHNSAAVKPDVTVDWRLKSGEKGEDIYFVATVAETKAKWWKGIKSSVVQYDPCKDAYAACGRVSCGRTQQCRLKNVTCVTTPCCPQPECYTPSASTCNFNEEFSTCGTSCQNYCGASKTRICTMQCVRGCFCKKGFVRKTMDDGIFCIEESGCPASSPGGPPPTVKPGPGNCKAGEQYNSCGSSCPDYCGAPKTRACTMNCVQGCFCPVGTVRERNSNSAACIPRSKCPQTTTTMPGPGSCKPGEQYMTCGSSCPDYCGAPKIRACTANCVVGCFCPPGFVRERDSRFAACIPKSKCPQTNTTLPPGKCANNEIFNSCGTPCQAYCGSPEMRPCTRNCAFGCFCPPGTVRKYDNKYAPCVRKEMCDDKPPMCGPNEVYQKCGPKCKKYCNQSPENMMCEMSCKSGCFCAMGYIRHNRYDGAPCVPDYACSPMTAGTKMVSVSATAVLLLAATWLF